MLGADVLMGIGGTPEGLMTACAVRALGGGMQMRLAPQSTREADVLRGAGVAIDRTLRLEELVWGEAFFVATGVSGGVLLRRPWQSDGAQLTESLVVASHAVQWIVDARAPEPAPLGQETDAG
jgi:fructose-1,6-bisphosphatase II